MAFFTSVTKLFGWKMALCWWIGPRRCVSLAESPCTTLWALLGHRQYLGQLTSSMWAATFSSHCWFRASFWADLTPASGWKIGIRHFSQQIRNRTKLFLWQWKCVGNYVSQPFFLCKVVCHAALSRWPKRPKELYFHPHAQFQGKKHFFAEPACRLLAWETRRLAWLWVMWCTRCSSLQGGLAKDGVAVSRLVNHNDLQIERDENLHLLTCEAADTLQNLGVAEELCHVCKMGRGRGKDGEQWVDIIFGSRFDLPFVWFCFYVWQ